MSFSEKRCSPRSAVSWFVNMREQSGAWVMGRASNASARGLKMQAPTGYRIGEELHLEIVIGVNNLVRGMVRVVRADPDGEGRNVYVVEFDSFEEDGYAVLKKALRSIRENVSIS